MSVLNIWRFYFSSDKELRQYIKNIFGFYPGNVFLYKLALRHKSATIKSVHGSKINNERLEYLGDAVLGLVVADYLFKRFPFKNEGFLTDMRSKMVSRSSLNKLSVKIGLKTLMTIGSNEKHFSRSAAGNAFEAFVGAIYLDIGYKRTRNVLIRSVFNVHFDLQQLQKEEISYKSKIIEWSQKNKREIEFVVKEETENGRTRYHVTTMIDGKPFACAQDYTIKGAENLSAEKSWALIVEKGEAG